MRAIIVALAMVVSGAAWSQAVPQFRQFATGPMYVGPRSAPDLSSRESYDYRTRLRAASPLDPNFASEHRAVTWGCGTSCQTGAVINQITGRVTFFPFSICCSTKQYDQGFNSIEFRSNSALIVFSGLRNEEGVDGAHFYEFNGRGFTFLATTPFQPASSETSSAPAAPPSPAPSVATTPVPSDDKLRKATDKVGYCVRPKVQYGQYSSFDGGKSAMDLMIKCVAEGSEYLDACKAGKPGGADPENNCSLALGLTVQLMIKEMGK